MPGPEDINEPQWRVLRWVADGCPDGAFEGYAYRVSAAALKSRGLVTLRGRGPAWRAELTERGADVIARFPVGPPPPRPPRVRTVKPPAPAEPKPTPAPAVVPGAKVDSERVATAEVPAAVVPEPEREAEPPRLKVELPDSLRGAVPIVTRTAEAVNRAKLDRSGRASVGGTGIFYVHASKNVARRALLALHAVTREARGRGWKIEPGKKGERGSTSPAIVAGRHRYYLAAEEQHDLIDFTPEEIHNWQNPKWDWERERRKGKKPPPQLKRRVANGKLRFTLASGTYSQRQLRLNDTIRFGPATGRLGELVECIEAWAPLDQRHVEDLRRAEERRERERREEADRRRRAALDERRAKRLLSEATDWQEAVLLRSYLDALAARVPDVPENDRARLEEWIEWSRTWADRIDPTVSVRRIRGLEQDGDYWW